jgi:hypothetical protein
MHAIGPPCDTKPHLKTWLMDRTPRTLHDHGTQLELPNFVLHHPHGLSRSFDHTTGVHV